MPRLSSFSTTAAQASAPVPSRGHHSRPLRTPSAPNNARLNQLLYRLRAADTDVMSSTATTNPLSQPVDDRSYISDEEASSLCTAQQDFLVRKRKAALGLGPIMPEGTKCACCSGFGTITCNQCKGTGYNVDGKLDSMFSSDGVRILNGVHDLKWFLMDKGPCWLCKGSEHIACSECSGTGIKGGVDRYTGD